VKQTVRYRGAKTGRKEEVICKESWTRLGGTRDASGNPLWNVWKGQLWAEGMRDEIEVLKILLLNLYGWFYVGPKEGRDRSKKLSDAWRSERRGSHPIKINVH